MVHRICVETSSHHYISIGQGIQKSVQICWIVLTVCIHLDKGRVATPLGVQESRTHSSTDSYIEGKRDDRSTRLGSPFCGEICRSIVDHVDIGLRAMLLDLRNDIRDRLFLVPRGNRD